MLKKWKRRTNPDFRHRSQVPAPEVEEIESRLYELISPSLLAPRQMERRNPDDPDKPIRMRARLLTLPVMMAVIIGLVFRRLPSLAEVQRVLESDGLLWVDPLKVSHQAINRRLDTMPAEVVSQLFQEMCDRLGSEASSESEGIWDHLCFSSILAVDGSTLEELRKKNAELRGTEECVLGGKIIVMVDLLGLRPVWADYTEESKVNEKRFSEEILCQVPEGGLLVYDLGYFSFGFFDEFKGQGKYFVTRMREKTAYKEVSVLSEGPFHRDRLIEVGIYRSSPCKYQLRLVEVLWGKDWYRYLTNVLDSELLSAKDVCELYRRRWKIEDAFKVTKRVLDLSYLWSGSTNAVQLQIYATLIFYTVLIEVCQQVAELLRQPLDTISVEMVFRGLYHYSRALLKGETLALAPYLAGRGQSLGIVKRQRKRNKERQKRTELIWANP